MNAEPAGAGWELTLFVRGAALHSLAAMQSLERLRSVLAPDALVHVVDVEDHPDLARQEQVMAVPTLVARGHGVTRRFVGSLGDLGQICHELGLADPHRSPPTPDPVGGTS